MLLTTDSFDDIWELAERAVREARVLRSFLEYLRDWPDLQDVKQKRIQNWRHEVGVQMGNPQVTDTAKELFQRLRDSPPELRRELVQAELTKADSQYF